MKNCRPGRPRDQNIAFTLIELLAVIAVIAILAAILIPVLTSATEKGNKMRCLSNLRQWGAGLALYISENSGFFPKNGSTTNSADAWFNAIPRVMRMETLSNLVASSQAPGPTPPYNKNMFTCPSLKAQQIGGVGGGSKPVFSYAYNDWIDKANRSPHSPSAFGQVLRLSQIRNPSVFVVWGDAAQTNSDVMGSANLAYRHDGGKAANVCFADGHVSSIEASSLTNTIWDPE